MKWCCDSFQSGYERWHGEGFFVFALPPVPVASTDPSFHITARVERGTSKLSCRTGMKHCPWCGANLVRYYRQSWQEMIDEKIAEEFK
jgi:hypothetical protein